MLDVRFLSLINYWDKRLTSSLARKLFELISSKEHFEALWDIDSGRFRTPVLAEVFY